LKLLKEFPFLARVRGEDGMFYGKRAEEIKNLVDGYTGWRSDGDMKTGSNTETFALIEDLRYYMDPRKDKLDNGYEILLEGLLDVQVEHPWCSVNIWGGKTQGEASHIYLLAIGCLICDRFPTAAYMDGDIYFGQCQRAINWANQYLSQPIHMPPTTDARRLLSRLRNAKLTDRQCLEAFFELVIAPRNREMGDSLKEFIPPQVLSDYYRVHLKPYCSMEAGKRYLPVQTLKEYLSMGLDFRELCRLVMVDPAGSQLTPDAFMRELLDRKLHIEGKTFDNSADPQQRSGWNGDETVNSLFLQALYAISGDHDLDAYIPLDTICADFQAVLGEDFDAKGLAESILREKIEESTQAILDDGPNNSSWERMAERQKQHAEKATYDVSSYDDLLKFRKTKDGGYSTVLPALDKDLTKSVRTVRGFADNAWDVFSGYDSAEREKWFREHYRTLITLEFHQKMLQNIMDDEFIRKYLGVYLIKCGSEVSAKFKHALLWNETLLNYYWEKSKDETSMD
jgi:hypothetical protein